VGALLELYHNPVSTCSQKVRLVLAEKELDYESHKIDLLKGEQHSPEYVKINPNHVVPTLVHDGAILFESTLINEYLDDAFPEHPMRPADPLARHAMRMWVRESDERLAPVAGFLILAVGTRHLILAKTPEERAASLAATADPVKRAKRASLIEHGVKAPEFVPVLRSFTDHLDSMEAGLSEAPWLSGDTYGLADAATFPYVLRLNQLGMSNLYDDQSRPRVGEWFRAACARPGFESAITSMLPAPLIESLGEHGEAAWPEIEEIVRNI
jgi:glutathione S-transferase